MHRRRALNGAVPQDSITELFVLPLHRVTVTTSNLSETPLGMRFLVFGIATLLTARPPVDLRSGAGRSSPGRDAAPAPASTSDLSQKQHSHVVVGGAFTYQRGERRRLVARAPRGHRLGVLPLDDI